MPSLTHQATPFDRSCCFCCKRKITADNISIERFSFLETGSIWNQHTLPRPHQNFEQTNKPKTAPRLTVTTLTFCQLPQHNLVFSNLQHSYRKSAFLVKRNTCSRVLQEQSQLCVFSSSEQADPALWKRQEDK